MRLFFADTGQIKSSNFVLRRRSEKTKASFHFRSSLAAINLK